MLPKIDYQAKQITYNIYTFFKKRKLDVKSTEHIYDVNIIDTVSEATGLSKSTVTRVIRAGNAMKLSGGSVVFRPQEKKKHVRQKRIEVNEAIETQIRRKVIQFYTVIKEVPSVRKLNAILREENILHCSTEYLRLLLHKLGFTNADEADSTGLLRERPDIVSTRLKYLKAIIGFKNQKKSIFYLNDTSQWPLKDVELTSQTEMPTLVMVHACGVGFTDRATLMMKLNSKGNKESGLDSIDNYDWMKNKVLKNIPPNSVIVLNVPCTEMIDSKGLDVKPTMGLSRLAMQEWLKHRNIPYKETESKANLLRLIKARIDKASYSIVKLLKEKGHQVLHLPPNQPDLNPVAVMWEAMTTDLHDASPKVLIGKFSKEKWKLCFEQVDEAENEYYDHDIKIDDVNHLQQLTVKEEPPEEEPLEGESEIMDYV